MAAANLRTHSHNRARPVETGIAAGRTFRQARHHRETNDAGTPIFDLTRAREKYAHQGHVEKAAQWTAKEGATETEVKALANPQGGP